MRDISLELKLPALERLLAKGRRRHADARSTEAWLCEQFSVDRQGGQGDWPVAPFSLLADGGEPGTHHWLRADPVHLKLDGNRLVLADSGVFDVSQQEAERLTDSLNAHFSDDGLAFYPLRPDRWYLRAERSPALETTALPEAAGKSIDALLPRGADAPIWRTRLNDAQMLLHGHAVNQEREEAGLLPINGVWPWGGGRLQGALSATLHAVWARDALALGLARAARIAAHPMPDGAADLLRQSGGEGVSLILLDGLRKAAQYGDAGGWREGLERLERDWFAPLLQVLAQGRIGMVSLHALGPGGVLSAEVTRGDLRRFWRRVKPLVDLAWQ
ncbi:MAG: hypothetical protein ABIH03_17305 [Pseudomonadota bacterium]